jgi:hypothetical protein
MARPLWNKIVGELGAHAPETEIWPTFYSEALIMSYKGELWDRLDYGAKVAATWCSTLTARCSTAGTISKKSWSRPYDDSFLASTDYRGRHSS